MLWSLPQINAREMHCERIVIGVKPVPEIKTISTLSQDHAVSKFGPKNLTLEVFLVSKWILSHFDMGQCTFLHFLYFQVFPFPFYLVRGKVENVATFLICSLY